MTEDTKDTIGGICVLAFAMSLLVGVGYVWGYARTPDFPRKETPCELNTIAPLEMTDSKGVKWVQLDRAIVGCSAQGISVLVPKP